MGIGSIRGYPKFVGRYSSQGDKQCKPGIQGMLTFVPEVQVAQFAVEQD